MKSTKARHRVLKKSSNGTWEPHSPQWSSRHVRKSRGARITDVTEKGQEKKEKRQAVEKKVENDEEKVEKDFNGFVEVVNASLTLKTKEHQEEKPEIVENEENKRSGGDSSEKGESGDKNERGFVKGSPKDQLNSASFCVLDREIGYDSELGEEGISSGLTIESIESIV